MTEKNKRLLLQRERQMRHTLIFVRSPGWLLTGTNEKHHRQSSTLVLETIHRKLSSYPEKRGTKNDDAMTIVDDTARTMVQKLMSPRR